jgi:hypothetical protein
MQPLHQEEFWSDVYRGRPIAIMSRGGQWHVYLDHLLQHNVIFATAEQAIRWLLVRIDVAACPSAIAWHKALDKTPYSPTRAPAGLSARV